MDAVDWGVLALLSCYTARQLLHLVGGPKRIPPSHPDYPFISQGMNGFPLINDLIRLKRLVFGSSPYTLEQLLEDVRKKQGETLTDDDLELLREPLEIMLNYINNPINSPGHAIMWYQNLVSNLSTRVLVSKQLREHPELGEVPDEPIVFIIGLPRTGSTLAQRLLANHPNARSTHFWKMMDFDLEKKTTKEESLQSAENVIKFLKWYVGSAAWTEMEKMHPINTTEPEEDQGLLQTCLIHEEYLQHPAYLEWFKHQDATRTYQLHTAFLNIMKQKYEEAGKTYWLIKAPIHTFFVSYILKQYPNAKFVWTHRDPKNSMGSSCLMRTFFHARMFKTYLDRREYRRRFLQSDMESLRMALEVRKQPGNEEKFVDLYFGDLKTDPIETIINVHKRLFGNCEQEEQFRENLENWLASDNYQRGPQYELEDYGITADQVDAAFAWYYKEFDKSRM